MNKLLSALILGLGLILAAFWGLFKLAQPPAAQAATTSPTSVFHTDAHLPQPQAGSGIIRVALTGINTAGCGSIATPCATIQFAVDEALAGDEIHIAGGVYAGVQLRNDLTQTVFIDKPLTLRGGYTPADGFTFSNPGANPTVLDAQRQGRVILISGTISVLLENLNINNGYTINIQEHGGGVRTLSATVSISNSTFFNNVVENGFSRGGALYTEQPLVLTATTFLSNTSGSSGGGVEARDTVTLIDSRFEQNVSLFSVGGGLRVGGDTMISNTIFLDNTALAAGAGSGHGGAIYGFEISLTVSNSLFENNHCLKERCNGGGLYLGSSFNFDNIRLILTDTDFISNSARHNGGGVQANSLTLISGGRFERNHAEGDITNSFNEGGGGLAVESLRLTGTTFLSNTTTETGGGAFVIANRFVSTAILTNAVMQGNTAADHGGGFAYRGSLLTPPPRLYNAQFVNNRSDNNGGGLWSRFNGALLFGGRFEDNQANGPDSSTTNGGGGTWAERTLIITDTQFINNLAAGNGGGIHVNNGDVLVNGGQFERNQSLAVNFFRAGGGGVYHNDGQLVLNATTMLSNTAATDGGGILGSGPLELTANLFQGNLSDRNGGGVAAFGPVTVTNGQFIANRANTFSGGALFLNETAALTNSLFFNNSGVFGGAIRAAERLTISNTQFISNSATTTGGAVSLTEVGNINHSLFQDNRSDGNGGALSASFEPLTLTNTNLISNVAGGNGGGIHSGIGRINLINGLIQNNQAEASGGGLYTASAINLSGSQFLSNTAVLTGGGAYANSGLTIVDGYFERNISGRSGGGVSAPLGELIFENTTFANNQAGGDGGGGHNGFRATLIDSLFESNIAQNNGGGLRVGNRVILTGTQFIGNTTLNDGGGLYMQRSSNVNPTFMVNGLFARNQAGGNGQALYLLDPNGFGGIVNLLHNTIAAPTPISGAAIYAAHGTVTLTNTIIASHTTGVEQAATGLVREDYTLFFGNNNNTVGNVTGGANSLVGNPAFVNPNNDNYRLTVASAAINQGVDAGVPIDAERQVRPAGGGFDIGFDEVDFINVPPQAQGDAAETAEDTPLIIAVLSNDHDENGDPLSISAVGTPANGASVISGTTLIYTPTLNFNGIDLFTYTISDGALSDTAPVTITVTPVNDAPQFTTLPKTIGVVDVAYSYDIVTTDVDQNDVMTISGVTLPGWLRLSDQGNGSATLVGIPTAGEVGDHRVVLQVGDGQLQDNQSFTITVALSAPPATTVYLPFILKTPPAAPPSPTYPDLVVEQVIAASDVVTVVVKNVGPADVVDAFWIDLYLNPSTPPSGVNQQWADLGAQGLVWGVTGSALPIISSGTLTLTLNDGYYRADLSNFSSPLPLGTPVYAQVDSVNLLTTYGGVLESHEVTGGVYNNISSTLSIAGVSDAGVPPADTPDLKSTQRLPLRQ